MAYIHVIDAIISILKTNLSDGLITSFYEGDPEVIGRSSLPAICVMKNAGKITVGPTGADDITDDITIKILLDKMDDMGASDNVDLTERRLRILMEDRDPVTGWYKPDSVVGILRRNYTLGGVTIQQDMAPSYYVVRRSGTAGEDIITSEAHLRINTRERVFVPNRT